MTEHCINNGTSICQTKDATHFVVTYKDFKYNKTFGSTYSGERIELVFHFITDFESPDDRLTLCVTSISDKTWHIICYDDPYNNSSSCSLKALPVKETVELYSVRDSEFAKCAELIIYIRFGNENILLLEEDIEVEEMMRLHKCLKFSLDECLFADMTVQDIWYVHRAVIAATSNVLDAAVSNLPFNETSTEYMTTTTNILPVSTDKDDEHTEKTLNNGEVKLQELAASILALANKLNMEIKDETSFIQHLQENIQDKSSADNVDEEITFKNPDPGDYTMEFKGLKPHVTQNIIDYIYMGELTYDFDSLHELITAALLYKLDGFVSLLENKLMTRITSKNVTKLLHISQRFKLDKLRLATTQHMRSLDFVQNHAQKGQDPFIHKCILSTPSHNFKTHGIFTFTVPKISRLTTYDSEIFYFCDCPIYVSVRKSVSNGTLSIYFFSSSKYRFMIKYSMKILIGTENEKIITSNWFVLCSKGKGNRKVLCWSDLIDPSKLYVKNDSIKIQVFIQVKEVWVDE